MCGLFGLPETQIQMNDSTICIRIRATCRRVGAGAATILTEKGLDKNMKIKPELTGNRVVECLKLKENLEGRENPSRAHPF